MTQILELEQYVANALDAVEFKWIRDGQSVEDAQTFHPDMAHQIFSMERIFGYKNLKIQFYFSAGPLDIYYNTKYSEKIDSLKMQGMKADDIDKAISELIPDGCLYTNLDEFLSIVKKKSAEFKPMGDKIMDFKTAGPEAREFEIYHCTYSTPNFLKYHSKLEPIVFWFVDAASTIVHDPLWNFFIVFEKYKTPSGDLRYASAGFCAVYHYYSYPENIRPRISQMMVLPPFQRLGVGSKIIEAIYSFYGSKENVTDITVEQPSESFQRMRWAVDARLCQKLPAFAPEKLKNGLSIEMLNEAKAKYKITPKQCRTVYEILRLAITDCNNEEDYKNYRLEVKKRLGMVYAKMKRDLVRAEKLGIDVTNVKANIPSDEQRMEEIQTEYKKNELWYLKIIKKLKEKA